MRVICNKMASRRTDYDFLERPSQDFFCPVSLELLLEPQLTSCCGHHLSLEAAKRLQREGRACPMCNGEQWSAMLDKYHRRRVHEVRVRCWHKDNSCEWVGELNEIEKHATSCEHRLWKCKYCGLRCEFVEGEGKHWPKCTRFPEPCPNSCEVGTVERCNMEKHRSVCSLEPVPCEMKEFGCSVVVPRKELATHMKESELQHLTAVTMLNLRLTKQLQQDSTERDRKITQLQEDSAERDKKIVQLQEEMAELNKLHCNNHHSMIAKVTKLNSQMTETITQMEQNITEKIERISSKPQDKKPSQQVVAKGSSTVQSSMIQKAPCVPVQPTLQSSAAISNAATYGGTSSWLQKLVQRTQQSSVANTASYGATAQPLLQWSGTETFIFKDYSSLKGTHTHELSEAFYTHWEGYKLKLKISFYDKNDIGAELFLMCGEYDLLLKWPVKIKIRLEVLNQVADRRHVVRVVTRDWSWGERGKAKSIDDYLMKCATLERGGPSLKYLVNDCLKFKINVTVPLA